MEQNSEISYDDKSGNVTYVKSNCDMSKTYQERRDKLKEDAYCFELKAELPSCDNPYSVEIFEDSIERCIETVTKFINGEITVSDITDLDKYNIFILREANEVECSAQCIYDLYIQYLFNLKCKLQGIEKTKPNFFEWAIVYWKCKEDGKTYHFKFR